MTRMACQECGSECSEATVLRAPNPFDEEQEVWGCPACKSVDGFDRLCDEPACRHVATCGTPHPSGYKFHCHHHPPA